jgi:photosystem II stability/assembly factor-like uncharacterized protein
MRKRLFVFFLVLGGCCPALLALGQSARVEGSWDTTDCCGLSIDGSNPQILYVAIPPGLFRSLDGGLSWSPLFLENVFDFAVDPGDGRHLLVGTSSGLARSTDGGASWTRLGFPPGSGLHREETFLFVAIDPVNPDTLYLVDHFKAFTGIMTASLVYKSADAGKSWSVIAGGDPRVSALLIDRSAPERLYVAGWAGGISRSNDGGATWSKTPYGTYAVWLNTLVPDPRDFSILYAGTASAGIFKSTDAGETWEAAGSGIDHPEPVITLDLMVAPSKPAEILANTATSDGLLVYRSDDGAQSWRSFLAGVSVAAIDPVHPETLYLWKAGRLLKTTDDGVTLRDITPSYERVHSSVLPPRARPRPVNPRP